MDLTRTILHADMDAFYASVEQRDTPALQGLPVIVGGIGRRGVVCAASYEARVYGVHSAMPSATARRLCPEGVFLPTRMGAYTAVSREVRSVFDRFTDMVEPLSLDEAFLDVTGSRRLFGDGARIAERLRTEIREATGLTVSVGVATSKYVAKVASDLDKPDGLTVAPPGQEAAFLGPLPIARLWGAGRVLQRRLAALGMTTIGDLQALTLERLVAELGESTGVHFYDLCRGLDSRPVMSASSPKSVSRETTFSDDVADDQMLNAVLLEHAEDVGRRLRYRGLAGRTLRIKLRYPPFETHSRQTRLTDPTCDDACIFRHAVSLLREARQSGRPVRLLGVGVSDLCAADVPVQRELFPSPTDDTAGAVNRTLDAIRDRFGGDVAGRLGGGLRRTSEPQEP